MSSLMACGEELCHCAGDSKKHSVSTAQTTGRTLTPCSHRPQAMKEFTTRSTHVNVWDKQKMHVFA